MTNPDVKNLHKLVKRVKRNRTERHMQETAEWYERLQRDLTELNESQKPVGVYDFIGRHARRVRDWANK